jgi:hypothetical protein
METKRIKIQGHLSKKYLRPHLKRKGWAWWHILLIPAIMGSINRKTAVQISPSKKQDPISTITRPPKKRERERESWRHESNSRVHVKQALSMNTTQFPSLVYSILFIFSSHWNLF